MTPPLLRYRLEGTAIAMLLPVEDAEHPPEVITLPTTLTQGPAQTWHLETPPTPRARIPAVDPDEFPE